LLASLPYEKSTKPQQSEEVAKSEEPSEDSFSSLRFPTLEDQLSLEPFTNYWTEYVNQPNYHLNIKYEGLHAVVIQQLSKLAKRYYNRALDNYWNNSDLHPLDILKQQREYNIQQSNSDYPWWDRSFHDSFPVEKGGQKIITYRVGCRSEVINIWGIKLFNDGKFSLSDWKLGVTDTDIDPALTNQSDLRLQTNQQRVGILIEPPVPELAISQFKVSFSTRANIRFETTENRSELKFILKFVYSNTKNEPIINMRVRISTQPFTGRAAIEAQLCLLEF